MNGLPDDGKMIVMSPQSAARAAEQAPEHAERIYVLPGLADDQAYVIDLDMIEMGFEIDRILGGLA